MSCPHNFLPQGGKYPLCGIDGGICFGPDHHRWDECPVYFGPWGAWRSVGREVSWRAEVISEMAQEYDTDRLNLGALFVSLAMYIEIRIYLEAVGWSPCTCGGHE